MIRFQLRCRGALAAALTGVAVVGTLVTPAAAHADTLPPAPVVTATVTNSAITLSTGGTHQAGHILFRVVATDGEHTLQLISLVTGYTLAQAQQDIAAGVDSKHRSLDALYRADVNIHWLGGALATPNHPGTFGKTLVAGSYYVIDREGPAVTPLTITGTAQQTQWITASSIIATNNDRWNSPSTLPSKGWTSFRNPKFEPHFLVFQQVKQSTTDQDVQNYIWNSDHSQPAPFYLAARTSTGVLSAPVQMYFHYNLPPGKYLIQDFWPDNENGVRHFFLGMYQLVQLTPTS